jgi:hypothetical protein
MYATSAGDEELDVVCDRRLWLMTTLQRHDLQLKRGAHGRAYFKLDPTTFTELAPREFNLALDTGGTLRLRVVMEQEQHDPQFHFGRAFRCLHLAQVEMIRMLVDKVSSSRSDAYYCQTDDVESQMTPTVRHVLSRTTLRQLLSSGSLFSGGIAGDAINKLSEAYRSSLKLKPSSNIPAVTMTMKDNGSRKDLSDVQVEAAIGPLLDYLDHNLEILSVGLTSTNLSMVLVRLWREIVAIIESLTIPALSARPSQMQPLSDKELDVVLRWLKASVF